VPSIRLLVAGDSVYGNTHPYKGESGIVVPRLAWIAALDKLALLDAKVVVGDPDSSFGPDAISETKALRISSDCGCVWDGSGGLWTEDGFAS
jgi:hypothetical protein